MGNKQLIRVPLTELRTYDEEVLGSIYEHAGKEYAWQKNSGTTALIARASCLQVITSVESGANMRVIAPDGAGASTAVIGMAAGVPMAAIGPSGSDTGDHGWVQVKGPAKVSVQQNATTALQVAGCIAIGTNAEVTTFPWGKPYLNTADSANTANLFARRVVLIGAIATTGVDTAVSALVDVQCR